MSDTTHQERILDQFTRQATPFSTASTITDANALRMIVEAARAAAGRHGAGCRLRRRHRGVRVRAAGEARDRHRHDAGDAGPRAAARGREGHRQRHLGPGDVGSLPYADGTFDIVVTRFSMHHFLDPLVVLREMVRVCAPGGRVVVVDMYASDDPAKAAEWNRAEKLRDPSHVRCLTLPELKGLFGAAGLPAPRASFYELRDEIRNLLAPFVPEPGRRREDHRDVRRIGRGRPAGHSGAARGGADRLRLSDRDPGCRRVMRGA